MPCSPSSWREWGGGFAYHQYTIARDCKAQSTLFTDQKADLDKTVKAAYDALHSVDASLKVGEGDRLVHTDGFPTSTEGQEAINTLNKALNKAEKHSKDTAPEQCSGGTTLASFKALTDARQTDLDALKAQTKAFTDVRDNARLAKASEEANTAMDTAKSDLAAAQKAATDQLAVVDGDTALQGDATVKAAYDALKKTENDSHSVSTTVTASTYEEAVSSIEKAKAVTAKTDEVNAATQALKDAIKAYQDAKAAEEAAAQAAAQAQAQAQAQARNTTRGSGTNSYSSGSSHAGSGSGSGSTAGRSRSGSGNYTAPAPAAPSGGSSGGGSSASRGGGNRGSSSGGSSSGSSGSSGSSSRIDLGPGAPDQKAPGCIIMEGKEYCNP